MLLLTRNSISTLSFVSAGSVAWPICNDCHNNFFDMFCEYGFEYQSFRMIYSRRICLFGFDTRAFVIYVGIDRHLFLAYSGKFYVVISYPIHILVHPQ